MFLRDTDIKASEETPASWWDKGVIQAFMLSYTGENTELFPFQSDVCRSDTRCKDVSGVLYCVNLYGMV